MLGCYSSCFFLVKESPPKVSQAEIGWTPRNNPKETTSAGLGQPKNPSGGIFLFILLWFRVFSDPKKQLWWWGQNLASRLQHSAFQNNKYMFVNLLMHFVISPWTKIPNEGGTIWLNRPKSADSPIWKFPPPQGLGPPYGLGNEVDALSIRSKHVCV